MEKNYFLNGLLPEINYKSIPLCKQDDFSEMEFLTLTQVFEEFPVIKQVFKWSEEDIRVLYESHLLIGKVEEKELLIEESSLKKLIEFRNKIK